jgi:hypothetical protein
MKGCGLLLVLSVGAGATGAAAESPLSREQAIKQTLDGINQEVQEHGGSFEQWGESLKPYREALARIRPTQWPWPAKQNFVFQGKEIDLVLRDTWDDEPESQRPFAVILDVHKKLKAEGVDLIFVPLPDKLAIYPDYLSDAAPADRKVAPAMKRLMKQLLESDVDCVDLYPAFHAFREKNPDKPLYYDRDSHWRNITAQLAAEQIARRLMRYDFVQQALAEGNRYSVKPERRQDKPDDLMVVLDAKSGKRYADAPNSPILITGDSNLMYNMGATGGHMPAHLGRHLGLPLTFGPNTTPAQHVGKLQGKKVAIWATIARAFAGSGGPKK